MEEEGVQLMQVGGMGDGGGGSAANVFTHLLVL